MFFPVPELRVTSYGLSHNGGFTLLEVVVTVTIVSLLTLIVTAALPAARSHQALRLAQQQVSDGLAAASHRAINEIRPPACTNRVAAAKRCSDVGVALQAGELIIFADTAEPQDWQYSEGQDEILATITLPTGVTTERQSFVFIATPPTLELYHDGQLMAAQEKIPLVLVSDRARVPLTVSSYGQVE